VTGLLYFPQTGKLHICTIEMYRLESDGIEIVDPVATKPPAQKKARTTTAVTAVAAPRVAEPRLTRYKSRPTAVWGCMLLFD